MRNLAVACLAAVILATTATASLTRPRTGFSPTPLDAYVNKPDSSFAYHDTGVRRSGKGWKGFVYNMTSQTWLNGTDSSQPVWWHWLVFIIPDEVTNHSKGFLYITGGDNRHKDAGGIPSDKSEDIGITASIAVASKTPAAVLFQVPNQPIKFPVDPFHKERVEDAAIALTWWYFLQHPEQPEWILELPMTKAGVRALDAMEAVLPTLLPAGYAPPKEFVVAGASKRGWTTWLVGAVDPRVAAIIPIVLDALNVVEFAHRQWQFYGAWTFALEDYYQMNITQSWDNPAMTTLMQIIDPWYYLPRLTMPKFAVNAGGDEFQMPDDQRHWGHDTVGPMHYLLVKNAEHSLATGVIEVLESIGAFAQAFVNDVPMPTYTWEHNETSGDIIVNTNTPPSRVAVIYSDSGLGVSQGRRDFRWAALNTSECFIKVFGACVRPLLWTTSKTEGLTQINATAWRVHMEPPADGWRAFTIEMHWPNPGGSDDFYFTAPASVVPTTRPFPDCHGEACKGTLC